MEASIPSGAVEDFPDLEHEIRCDGRVAAAGKSVLVGYDYDRGESIPLSDDWKRRLAHER